MSVALSRQSSGRLYHGPGPPPQEDARLFQTWQEQPKNAQLKLGLLLLAGGGFPRSVSPQKFPQHLIPDASDFKLSAELRATFARPVIAKNATCPHAKMP